MLGDLSGVSKIFVITGRTDMKKSFDGLMAIVRDSLSAVWLMHAVNFLMPFQKEGKKESGFWISTRSRHWMNPFLQRKMKICFLLKKESPSAIVCSSRNVCMYKELSPEDRKAKRLEEETPIWDEFWSWIDTLDPSGGSKLEKAVKYALNHKESLMNYLLDGRCEISNNSAERKAKVYATGRKNFLFHDSVDGAKATAIVMSLVETAKANNLNAYKYLYTLLLYMPDYKNEPAGIEQLLPWSTFVQDKCSGIIDDSLELPENRGNLPI